VIIIVSHSDGLNPFLNFFEQKEMINRVWYCCTVAVDLTKLDSDELYKVEDVQILQKKPMTSNTLSKPDVILDSSPESLE
jgi:hypothetical protein